MVSVISLPSLNSAWPYLKGNVILGQEGYKLHQSTEEGVL